ncbi:MAG: Uma2 family endonuclease [Thermomicrobiales bacterium]
MAIETRISEQAYKRLVFAEPDQSWELWDGWPREKPGMTWEHSTIIVLLGHFLLLQLDRGQHEVLAEARVRRSTGTIYIPDLVVAPTAMGAALRGRPGTLAIFSDPLPLVVEVWSSSTGDYDIDAKIPEYQRRGDLEIWLIHPYERSLTAWRRLANGSYEETFYREGIVRPVALPGVEIDLAKLFDA